MNHAHMNHADFDGRGVLDATLKNGRWQVATPHQDAEYRPPVLPESGRKDGLDSGAGGTRSSGGEGWILIFPAAAAIGWLVGWIVGVISQGGR